ncbi:MAG: aldehyde dehydrogenase, partial [Firmicutes bacterium]|nr:aldehyde dehydrogenase [Bacillota bacterium]
MSWTEEGIAELVESQRAYFRSGATLDVDFRILQLKRLKTAMQIYEEDIKEALAQDLGRDGAEAYFCDIGTVILETNEM